MTTTTTRTRPPSPGTEARVVLNDVSWSLYQEIAASRGGRPVPRLTYLDGVLELMSPSFRHESLSRRLGTFVLMLARGLGRPCLDAGSTRWERPELARGKEPDACFYLENEPAVRGLTEVDLSVQPPPDLAVEVELTHPLNDALGVYAGLRVPEVWTFDGRSLTFFHLDESGGYVERDESRSFPGLRARDALRRLAEADATDLASWSSAVEDWARRGWTTP